MESTNELVPKVLAAAEGLSITSSNECMTKGEFVENFIKGLSLNINDKVFSSKDGIACAAFINNSSKDILLKIESINSNGTNGIVEENVPAKSIKIMESYATPPTGGGQRARLTILTNIRYTSYAYLYNYLESGSMKIDYINAFNVENIVDNNLNIIDYKSSLRYGNMFCGTFVFND